MAALNEVQKLLDGFGRDMGRLDMSEKYEYLLMFVQELVDENSEVLRDLSIFLDDQVMESAHL